LRPEDFFLDEDFFEEDFFAELRDEDFLDEDFFAGDLRWVLFLLEDFLVDVFLPNDFLRLAFFVAIR
jgi:hypothetical protein